jgi:arylsulfatase A-like enzyme
LLGKDKKGRAHVVLNANSFAIRQGPWKYILPSNGPARFEAVNIESGLAAAAQLYNLEKDPGEKENLAQQYPEKVAELKALLEKVRQGSGDR